MPKKIVTWVLVADGEHATVFEHDGPGRGLNAVDSPTFQASPIQYTRDAVTDREGRSWGAGGVGRHGMEPRTDPKRQSEQEFVREVAQALGQAALAGRFERLILVAPPKALGDLRAQLPKHAQDRVTHEIAKDLVHLDSGALEKHLINDNVLV